MNSVQKKINYQFRKVIRRLPGIVIQWVPKPNPEVVEGCGVRGKVGELCRGSSHVLLVTDSTLYRLGFHHAIVASLQEEHIDCSVFNEIDSEPDSDVVEAGRKVAKDHQVDCIVALGGGSVMDASKMIATSFAKPHRSVRSLLHKFLFVLGKTMPLITIPTTAGTGAEHTVGAVVKDARKGNKCAVVVVGLTVKGVLLDSELTLKTPPKITAACGIDALSHGIEGCLADVKVPREDVQKSEECVRLVFENLPEVLRKPDNLAARQALSRAAFYGGNAINKQLAGYVHAFAHSIGACYHLPHGEAIALCLMPVLRYQKEVCLKDLARLAEVCGIQQQDEETAAEQFLQALDTLIVDCGIQRNGAILQRNDFQHLVRLIAADSINYSPKTTFSDKDILKVLEMIIKL